MRKAVAFLIFLIVITVLTFAQEDDGDIPVFDEWDIYMSDIYASGDQIFIISLGTVFPTFFLNDGNLIKHNITPPVGGTGSLSYNYFLNANLFLGGEVGGMFFSTLANHMLYIIPLGLRTGYQFYFWRFEFPVNLTIGMVWHNYISNQYYGLYIKGGGSAFYRYNPDWSFGLNLNWYWFPQWTSKGREIEHGIPVERNRNVYGNFIELTLSARYHF